MRGMNTYHVRVQFPCESGVKDVSFYDIESRDSNRALEVARILASSRLRVEVMKVTEAPGCKRKNRPKPYRITCYGGG